MMFNRWDNIMGNRNLDNRLRRLLIHLSELNADNEVEEQPNGFMVDATIDGIQVMIHLNHKAMNRPDCSWLVESKITSGSDAALYEYLLSLEQKPDNVIDLFPGR